MFSRSENLDGDCKSESLNPCYVFFMQEKNAYFIKQQYDGKA
jgi:hypothetical protein